ncbi:MAG: type II toxin-antitoxin system HicA family toxin [Candidatus Rokuibacteriota bacterium]
MTGLPVCSGTAAIRAFTRAGWTEDRRRGSHATLTKPDSFVILTVPLHDELDRGLLRSLIRKAGLTVEEFSVLLD